MILPFVYRQLDATDRERARAVSLDEVTAAQSAYCDLLVCDATDVVRAVMPTAHEVEFTFERDVDATWSVTVNAVNDRDGDQLYDGHTFGTDDLAGNHERDGEWDGEEKLRDILVKILEAADWYFGDPPADSTLQLND